MTKKYELTEEVLKHEGHILHRIKALRSFGDVMAGQLGGWVESEDNLSHEGDCWVAGEAKVFGNAKVYGNAGVFDNARVSGNSQIFDNALVYQDAWVYGNTRVFGNAQVLDNASVCGHAWVCHFACVGGHAWVSGGAIISEYAFVSDNAIISDDAKVYGNAQITGDAKVKEMGDYIVFQNIWSSGRWFTWTRSNDMWRVGCFYGTGEELIKKAYADSKESGDKYKAIVEATEVLK